LCSVDFGTPLPVNAVPSSILTQLAGIIESIAQAPLMTGRRNGGAR
jgi:hypothetical protein